MFYEIFSVKPGVQYDEVLLEPKHENDSKNYEELRAQAIKGSYSSLIKLFAAGVAITCIGGLIDFDKILKTQIGVVSIYFVLMILLFVLERRFKNSIAKLAPLIFVS